MKIPVELTRTLPEFDQIILIINEKFSNFIKYGHHMDLVWVWLL